MTSRLLVLLGALLAAVHAASFLGAGPHDDEFIVHRYARHCLQGEGLVFNPGERVEGFSTPGWTLVHAGAQLLRIPPVTTSLLLSILACAVATWAVGELWRRRFADEVWPVPALILAALPAFGWHAVVGLGTTFLAALLATWLWAFDRAERRRQTPWLAGCLLAAACLVRQECALFALPFAWSQLRARRFGVALLPWVAIGAWTGFRLLYYGRVVPTSYSVKKLPLLEDLRYGLEYLGLSTLECGIAVAVLAACFAPLATSSALRVARSGLLLFVAFVVYVGGDYMPLARFFVPVLPIAAVLGSLGVRRLIAERRDTRLAMVLVAVLTPQWTQRERAQLFGEQEFFVQRWEALGRHFGRILPADAKVAISPIGAFGWHSSLPIVDMLGLTNERILAAEPDLEIAMKGHHRYDAEWVLEERPVAVILFNGVFQPHLQQWVVNPWERELYEHPRFAQNYAAVTTLIEGSDPLLFFLRRDWPLPQGAQYANR